MNANLAIQNLRYRLLAAGYETAEVDSICDQTAAIISDKIADAVAGALSAAEQAGLDIGALNFAAELQAVPSGNGFMITTDSGKTDFSEPPFPMLGSILKSAKTSKDGSRYQRIFINNKSSTASVSTSSNAVIEQRDLLLREAKLNINTQLSDQHTPDTMQAARNYAEAYKGTRSKKQSFIRPKKTAAGGDGNWVTASSKQNPTTQWIRPAKEFDMTAAISDINSNLRSTIETIISDALSQYGA